MPGNVLLRFTASLPFLLAAPYLALFLRPVPAGTYYYIIKCDCVLNGQEIIYQGDIVIIKIMCKTYTVEPLIMILVIMINLILFMILRHFRNIHRAFTFRVKRKERNSEKFRLSHFSHFGRLDGFNFVVLITIKN